MSNRGSVARTVASHLIAMPLLLLWAATFACSGRIEVGQTSNGAGGSGATTTTGGSSSGGDPLEVATSIVTQRSEPQRWAADRRDSMRDIRQIYRR
jgi:hypothetical protein